MTSMQFRYESASARVERLSDDLALLHSLESTRPRQGHATKLLQTITAWADGNNVAMVLTAQAYGKDVLMDNYQLMDFYAKHGFVRAKDEPYFPIRMRREPSQVLQRP